MKRIFAFLSLLLFPTFVFAETLEEYELQFWWKEYVDNANIIFDKIDLETARAICRKTFYFAERKGVINVHTSKGMLLDKTLCNDELIDFTEKDKKNIIMGVSVSVAQKVLDLSKYYTDEQKCRISIAYDMWNAFFLSIETSGIYNCYESEEDIICSDGNDGRCIINRFCMNDSDEKIYFSTCVKISEIDDKCKSMKKSYGSWAGGLNRKTYFGDFDKDCNPLFKE